MAVQWMMLEERGCWKLIIYDHFHTFVLTVAKSHVKHMRYREDGNEFDWQGLKT